MTAHDLDAGAPANTQAPIAAQPSAFTEAVGVRLVEWVPGQATLCLDMTEAHLNRNGFVHGGVLMTMMDVAGGYAGTWTPARDGARLSATLTLSTSFIAPARAGRLTAIATVTGGGRKIYFVHTEVRNEDGLLIAMGQGSFRYR